MNLIPLLPEDKTFPEYESDDFDRGYSFCRTQCIQALPAIEQAIRDAVDGDTYRAVRVLSEIVDFNQVTPDIRLSASMYVEAYQKQKEADYVKFLLQRISDLRETIAFLKTKEETK